MSSVLMTPMKPPVALENGDVPQDCVARIPFEEDSQSAEIVVKNPAIKPTDKRVWIPLYTVAFALIAAAFALLCVCLTMNLFYKDFSDTPYFKLEFSIFDFSKGCATPGLLDYTYPLATGDSAQSKAAAQLLPFKGTCSELNPNLLNVSFTSLTSKVHFSFSILSSYDDAGNYNGYSMSIKRMGDFGYDIGFYSYHAIGAPLIYSIYYPTQKKALAILILTLIFNGVAVVLFASTIGLRATISPAIAAKTQERCCVSNVPNHTRRLTAAVIALLSSSVITGMALMIFCNEKDLSYDGQTYYDSDDDLYGATLYTKFWGVVIPFYVFNFVALILVCVICGMRV